MKLKLFFILLICEFTLSFSQQISGRVVVDGAVPMANVLVVNINNNQKSATNSDGIFTIEAIAGNEIRFVKSGYMRQSVVVDASPAFYTVNLNPVEREIEEVRVSPVKLSGNLQKDAKSLAKTDKMDAVRKEIGVPAPPEKPRETPPPTAKDIGVVAFALSNLNLNTLYKNISGDARRMRQLYKFEDQQDLEMWILDRLGAPYFTERGITEEKIISFLDYAILNNPEVTKYVKAKNIDGVTTRLEDLIPKFLKLNNKP